MSLYLLSVQVLSMAVRPLNTIFLFLLIAASTMGQGENHTESEAVYLKLENVLLTDHKSRYMMQRGFFPSQDFSPDWFYLNVCVTVNSVQPGGCGDFGGQSNFSYCQKFQWSSSALANLISIDQLLILDNVISESIVRITQHRKYLQFPLHIDGLPCYATEDDILTALLQLLPWVSTLFLIISALMSALRLTMTVIGQ